MEKVMERHGISKAQNSMSPECCSDTDEYVLSNGFTQ